MKNFKFFLIHILIFTIYSCKKNENSLHSHIINKNDSITELKVRPNEIKKKILSIPTVIMMITVAKKYDNNHSYFYDEREQAEGPITKINVALPIAIYRNGKYVSPPTKYCFINTIEQEEFYRSHPKELKKMKKSYSDSEKFLKPIVSKGNFVFILDNGRQIDSLKIIGRTEFGISDWSTYSAILPKNINQKLVTNNPYIGKLPLIKLTSKPILSKRFEDPIYDENGNLIGRPSEYKNTLLSQLDIDGDCYPEMIYECEDYEGTFYVIYSYKNGKWNKVYDGGYQGT